MTEEALFGAGCFWGVQASFDQLDGVLKTEVGYSGGDVMNPTYEEVCSGGTGHVEVVKVTFDPSIITYKELVEHFFEIHDPTTRDRQGPDTGKQYRSVIFFTSDGQRKEAEDVRRRLDGSGHLDAPVVTDISPAGPFYRAEEYHQHYYSRNGFPGCVL